MARLTEALMEFRLLEFLPVATRTALLVYLAFKFLDFVTGILKTRGNNENPFKSAKMRQGINRWIAELVGITFVMIFDLFLGFDFFLTSLTLIGYIYKESRSIFENLNELGVELPWQVREKIDALENKKEDGTNG